MTKKAAKLAAAHAAQVAHIEELLVELDALVLDPNHVKIIREHLPVLADETIERLNWMAGSLEDSVKTAKWSASVREAVGDKLVGTPR